MSRRRVVLLAWLALLAGWLVYLRVGGRSPASSAQAFVDLLRDAWWAVPAYVAAYAARPLLLFPASVLTLAGGVLFGPALGVLITVVAANTSAMVAYGVGRTLGSPPTPEDGDGSLVRRWSGRLRERSFVTVMIMRLALLPYDLVNYLCGYLRIRPLPYLTATAIGSLPGTVAFVLAGASLQRVDTGLAGFDWRIFAASAAFFAVSLVVARIVHRRGTFE